MSFESEENRSFNIYYLNFSKVYEISMMINNVIPKSIQNEKATKNEKGAKIKAGFSGKAGDYLNEIKSYFSTEMGKNKITYSNVVESLDIKTTKSILLQRIIEKSKEIKSLCSCIEGDLIKINNVKLEILEEDNLRQILMLRKEALKGFRIEGMDVNNLVGSILQDYSYVLHGRIDGNQDIIIKIPMEIEDDFENKYNVDDLLVGHVSIIGVYKGQVTKEHIKSNTFNYFEKIGMLDDENSSNNSNVITSNYSSHKNAQEKKQKTDNDKDEHHYIDVISIIQDIRYEKEEEDKTFLQKIKHFFEWNKKNNE